MSACPDETSAPPDGRWVSGNDWTVLDGLRAPVPPRVSVIVLHHEQPAELQRTLWALTHQDYPADRVETIVSDDGSAQAPDVPENVQLVIQSRDGARRSAARNRGVQASTGELLVFLDADTTPEPDFLTQLTRLPALAPEAVCVGRRRHADLTGTAHDRPVQELGPARELPSPKWLSDAYASSENLRHSGPRSFRYMISAVLCVSRWFFTEAGAFDESFTAYGGEDWEWAHRAWMCGAIFAHEPAAVAWHDGPEWAARTAADRVVAREHKNAEAVRLSGLIPVAGHRPRGLRTRRPEATVRLAPEIDADGAFISVDGLLAALPDATVLLPNTASVRYQGDPRIRTEAHADAPGPALIIDIHTGVHVDPGRFRDVCQKILDRDIGSCQLVDDAGVLIQIETRRHQLRQARWGSRAGLSQHTLRDAGLLRLPVPPDVEAYLGGWAPRT